MKITSFEHFDISPLRISMLAIVASTSVASMTGALAGNVLRQAEPVTLVVVGALVFYIVLSTPRRLIDGQRVAQARESLLISAQASACLTVAGSRPRSLLLLRPREETFAKAVAGAGRMVLLGTKVEKAVGLSSRGLSSYSASNALLGLATLSSRTPVVGGEETRGLATSSELSRETRLPVFMTICFFAPIMLTLYTVFSHLYEPAILAELSALEFVVIDLAYFLCSVDRIPQ